MTLNTVCDLAFSQNHPLESADYYYIRILKNKIFEKTYDVLDEIKKQED
jgi:hypothetical protein